MSTRREAMLAEGFRLFAEKGIEPVSMLDVAGACGLGVATLYRYYSTKLALAVVAVMSEQESNSPPTASISYRYIGTPDEYRTFTRLTPRM